MGPVRRRLTAAATAIVAPSAALAQSCAAIRPDWTADAGPQSVLAESTYILASPPVLALALLLALGAYFPRIWLAFPAALLTLGFAGLLFLSRQSDAAAQALAEGCIATPLPALIILVLAAAAVMVRAFRRA